MISLILLVAAFICFLLVAIGAISSTRINLTALGLALWALSALLTGRV